MSDIGKSERATQNRVIALFRDELDYRFMGDWSDRANRQIEEGLLRDWLANRDTPLSRSAGRSTCWTARRITPRAASTTTTGRCTACCAMAWT